MYVKELKEVGPDGSSDENSVLDHRHREIILPDAKRVLVGAGARFLFYPTLLYNVIRNKVQAEFRWWDEVDQFVLLGAVPFPNDVPRLKQLGVQGVITLNEPYETLVPTSLYLAYGIDHLVIPTRDYLFAPSFVDIHQAVDFIHKNASCGKTTYVHCKAGRGRSTTIVLCYLVQYKQMTPSTAYQYVKSSRPRVLLAASQWQAVENYYRVTMRKIGISSCLDNAVAARRSCAPPVLMEGPIHEDGSIVVVTESDLDGYEGNHTANVVGNDLWAELSFVYRVQFAGQAALARLSYLWIGCHARRKIVPRELETSCANPLKGTDEGIGDIPVY